MLNLFLLTAGTWTAISFLFVWRLASAIPLGSDHAADTLPVDREARVSPRACMYCMDARHQASAPFVRAGAHSHRETRRLLRAVSRARELLMRQRVRN